MKMRKLEEELARYADSGAYPFHMPGHKRRGSALHRTDITEIDGFDNLHDPRGLILEEMQWAARFYGTKETYFSVNGSTCAILAAVCAAVPRGGRLLIPRDAHISVYHAAELADLTLLYEDGEDAAPDAVLITSPSYLGRCADVAHRAAEAKRRGIPLIVDEAHGAHFSMHPYFPESAVRLGADVVIQSLHKTLPAMTQTAVLHNVTGRVSGRRLQKYLDIFETSSPSYVLLASAAGAVHWCMEEGPAAFSEYAARLREVRRALAGLRHFGLNGGAEAPRGMDPGKLVITCGGALDGPGLYDRLRERYRLQPEMCGERYVLLMTSPMDTKEGFDALVRAMREIDAETSVFPAEASAEAGGSGAADGSGAAPVEALPAEIAAMPLPRVRMRIAEAANAPDEAVPLEEAAGRTASDYVIVYPPDVPLIVPGEVFPEALPGLISEMARRGRGVIGAEGGCVRCVKG